MSSNASRPGACPDLPFMMRACRYSEGSETRTWLLVYLLPNSFWLVLPALVVLSMGGRIAACLQSAHAKGA